MTDISTMPATRLPHWAFRALVSHAIDALIERTEHEIIISTRAGRPELVLMSHTDWDRLNADTASVNRKAASTATQAPDD